MVDLPKVYLLDYVAGNVRSLVNAIEKVGYSIEWVKTPEDVEKADVSVGVSIIHLSLYSSCTTPRSLLTCVLETDSAWCWSFRTLHDSILFRWLPPRYTKAH
jgi:hypothetical protein